ncbi:MAG: thiamine pyrophosphate-binding protein [Bacteroidota bacterium]
MKKYPSIDSAQTILLNCELHGIQNVVISPGSRNSPLAFGFASNPKFNCFSIIDERSAGFFALGISQQTKKPTVLLCTSGSALLNYAPSVSEAFFSQIPLIIISADRPKHKIGIGDSQTIFQEQVFGKNILESKALMQDVNHNTDELLKSNTQKILKKNSTDRSIRKLQNDIQTSNDKIIKNSFSKCLSSLKPIHINVPFEEPLYNFQEKPTVSISSLLKKTPEKKSSTIEKEYRLEQFKKIIILIGSTDKSLMSKKLLEKISLNKNIVVLKETLSNIHHPSFFGKIDQIIAPIELQNERDKLFKELQPDLLITIGGMVVSKKIKTFLRNFSPKKHFHVGLNDAKDTFYCGVKHIKAQAENFFINSLPKKPINSDYHDKWMSISNNRNKLHVLEMKKIPFCDLKVFSVLNSKIPNNYNVQVSNSSPIRYFQLFDQNITCPMFCNRGTSGIDGSLSTAVGASWISKHPTLFVTGDLSFFYDSNGLFNNYVRKDLRIIVINNSGGGIFKILPGYSKEKTHETFIETRHNYNSKELAKMYGFKYSHVSSLLGLKFSLFNFFKTSSKPKILEIKTSSQLSSQILKQYFQNLKTLNI